MGLFGNKHERNCIGKSIFVKSGQTRIFELLTDELPEQLKNDYVSVQVYECPICKMSPPRDGSGSFLYYIKWREDAIRYAGFQCHNCKPELVTNMKFVQKRGDVMTL